MRIKGIFIKIDSPYTIKGGQIMAVRLSKGQKVNLRKEAPNLKRVRIGLGWDPVNQEEPQASETVGFASCIKKLLGIAPKQTGQLKMEKKPEMDIDASVGCINGNFKCKEIVCYYNLEAYNAAIVHQGDNLTGEGLDGVDDEQIVIKLDEIPKNIQVLSIIINIYRAYEKFQDFGQVKNCYVHVTDLDSGKELVSYQVDGNFEGKTGIFVADLRRCEDRNDWEIEAKGEGVRVRDIKEMFGIKYKLKL